MADITGTISGTTANAEIKSRILWEETVDVAANAGSVTATIQLRTYTGYTTYSHDSDFYLKINGTTYSAMSKYVELAPESGWVTCFSKTVSGIAHNADGTKSIALSGWGNMYGTSVSSITCGDTAILYAIPRASTVSVTSAVEINGTNAVSVAITRASDAYTHRVDIYAGTSYDAATYRVRFTGVATSKAYAIPASWRLCMPTAMAGKAKVTVATFSGDTQIGDSRTAEFTISVPASVKPAITASNVTISPAQPSAISTFAHFVQGYSAVKATFAGTASAFGSEVAITETYIQYGSAKVVGNPAQTAVIAASGDIAVTVGVKDARGQLSTATRAVKIEEYSPPSMSGIDVFRCLLAGTASDAGTYASVKAKAIFSACGGDNALSSFRAQYKAATASAYGAWTNLASGVAKVIGGGALLVTQSYDVQLQIQDTVGNAASWTGRIPTADVALNLKAGGRGVGFGKFAEAEELADFDYPIKAPDLQVATHNLKTYTSVAQLGLTSGEPTINAVFAAMPSNSILRCTPDHFVSGETPTIYGHIELYKGSNIARSSLVFWGKDTGDGIHRKYLEIAGTAFRAEWHRILDYPNAAAALSQLGAVAKSGDAMTGDLRIEKNSPSLRLNSSGGTSGLVANYTSGTSLQAIESDGAYRGISIMSEASSPNPETAFRIHQENGNWFDLLSQLNCRFGLTSGIQVSANSYADASFTFSPAFSSGITPLVFLTIAGSHTNSSIGSVAWEVTARSNTGFSVRVLNDSGSAYSVAFAYFAFGTN